METTRTQRRNNKKSTEKIDELVKAFNDEVIKSNYDKEAYKKAFDKYNKIWKAWACKQTFKVKLNYFEEFISLCSIEAIKTKQNESN